MSVKQKLLLYAAPALMCLVAGTQRYLVTTDHLDAWRGGGFGMFSTISGLSLRQLGVTLITADNRELHCPPGEIENRIPLWGRMLREKKELVTYPRKGRMERLARMLADGEWVAYRAPNSLNGLPLMKQDVPPEGETRDLSLRAVRVELWEYQPDQDVRRYQPGLRRFHPALVMSATAPVRK